MLVPVSAHGSAKDRNCGLGAHDGLNNAEQVEGAAAREAASRSHVAGGQFVEHPVKLAPVWPRARHLLPVNIPAAASGGAELVGLRGEGLPVGRDAGIADEAFFRMCFGPISYGKCNPWILQARYFCQNP